MEELKKMGNNLMASGKYKGWAAQTFTNGNKYLFGNPKSGQEPYFFHEQKAPMTWAESHYVTGMLRSIGFFRKKKPTKKKKGWR